MIRKAFIGLATATTMVAWPLAAAGQSYNQPPGASQTTPPAADSTPQGGDTKKAKPTDEDSDSGGTVVRAGPDAGMVIARHHRAKKPMTDGESNAPSKENKCTQPCV